MPVLAAVLDACGKVIAVDPLALEQSGLAPDKVIGTHFANCYWFSFSTAGADALRQDLFRARLGFSTRRETIMRVRGVERHPVLIQCKPCPDAGGEIHEIVVIALGLASETVSYEPVQSEIARLTTINRELVHRTKNLFATVLATLPISYRQTATREALLEMAYTRIAALSKAHLLTVDTGQRKPVDAVSLEELVRTVIGPYLTRVEMGAGSGRDAEIPVKYLTPLTLILHDLVRGSVKYGSLGRDDSNLHISWAEKAIGASVTTGECGISSLVWSETCACEPMVAQSDGFGSALMQRCASQIEARIEVSHGPNAREVKLLFD